MSTPKYSTGRGSRILRDRDGGRVALTDHALHRWRGRTPHDTGVSVREAWRRGEWLQHPAVVQSEGEDEAPDDARLYRHGGRWGVVFLVVEDPRVSPSPRNVARIVATIAAIETFDHGPTRAYLSGHGPHYHPDDDATTGGSDA